MARASATAENNAISGCLNNSTTYYLSIHSADPGTTGASEITGYTGNRPAITFGSPSAGTVASTNQQSFNSMPAEAGGVPYVGVWTAATGGTYLVGMPTSGLGGAILLGDNIIFLTGNVTESIS